MKTQIVSLITLLAFIATLSAVWGQAPSPPPPAKPSVVQPVAPSMYHPSRFNAVDNDNIVLSATGKSPVDKAAVKAREEREAESYQDVLDGEAFFKAGKIQEAIASYKDALAVNPTDSLASERIAEADMACGKLDEASQIFHELLVVGFGSGVGGNADVWARYALVLVKTKQDTEAIQIYNHAAFMADYECDLQHQNKLIPNIPALFPEVVMGDALPGQVSYTPEHLQALADVLLAHTQPGFWSYKEIKAHALEALKLYPESAAVQYYVGDALSGSYYAIIDSPVKDKAAAEAAFQEDKKEEAVAYKKAIELGDDRTVTAAKERLKTMR